MALKIANQAWSTLNGAILATDTSITVQAGDGAKFPALSGGDWFPGVLVDSSGLWEIVKVTAVAGDVLTIARAQEGTAALAFASGSLFELRMTKAAFDAFVQGTLAAAGDFLGNAAGKVLSPNAVWSDGFPVNLGNLTGTLTFDFATYLNGYGTLTGNITLGTTSNLKYGQSGVIALQQDATGSRTLALNTSYWECDGGTVPTLSTAANATDLLIYFIRDNGKISIMLRKDSK